MGCVRTVGGGMVAIRCDESANAAEGEGGGEGKEAGANKRRLVGFTTASHSPFPDAVDLIARGTVHPRRSRKARAPPEPQTEKILEATTKECAAALDLSGRSCDGKIEAREQSARRRTSEAR